MRKRYIKIAASNAIKKLARRVIHCRNMLYHAEESYGVVSRLQWQIERDTCLIRMIMIRDRFLSDKNDLLNKIIEPVIDQFLEDKK